MIKVGKYRSVKVKDEFSCFVKFDYDRVLVEKIKMLPTRHYMPDDKTWEIPISDIDRLINTFGRDNITVHNDFPEFAKQLESSRVIKKDERTVDELIGYYANLKPVVDFEFKTVPMGHQYETFNKSFEYNNLLITDLMGLGKTAQSIYIMDYKRSIKQVKHVIVLCGLNSLKYNWVEEISKHSHNNCQVIDGTAKQKIQKLKNYWMFYYNIVNIESIRYKDGENNDGEQVNTNEFLELLSKLCDSGKIDGIIFDEFHKANNHKSQQGKGLRYLQVPYKIAMSGTPITKHVEKSWNILSWFGYETASYWNFVRRYCILGGFSGYDVIGYQNLDELHERFDKYQIRRTKDILKLPPKIYNTVYVDMTDDELKEYKDIKRGILRDVESGDVKIINPAVATIKLRMFTDKVKIRAVKEILSELHDNNEPAIIFSIYKEGIYRLREELKDYNPIEVTGDILDTHQRQLLIEDFQTNKRSDVIMGTIQVLGTGYTLTRSQNVIFLNKSWTPTDNVQAEDRAHRIGTTGSVTITTIVVKNSIDERVEEILFNDSLYIDCVVDGIPIFRDNAQTVFDKLMED